MKQLREEIEYILRTDKHLGIENHVERLIDLFKKHTKPKTKPLEERKRAFSDKLSEYKNEYPRDMLKDFYYYWTEHGDNDKKMRFEKEKSFGIKRRLVTWAKNQEKFNKGNDKPDKMETIINW